MISEKHKATFIHIPKTGGSTISSVLSRNEFKSLQERRVGCECQVLDPRLWTIKHARMHELDMKHQNFFCFAFVRNPWDLMVSSYNWWVQNTKANIRKKYGHILKQKGFNFFIKTHSSFINECYHQNNGQLHWLNDKINFIGKFENFQADFDIVCEKIGIGHQKLPHLNKTKRKHYASYYDDETKQIIAAAFSRDIQRFGYKFGE